MYILLSETDFISSFFMELYDGLMLIRLFLMKFLYLENSLKAIDYYNTVSFSD